MSRDLAARAREFHHEVQAAVCDVIEPWEHGTVVRSTRYPHYWDFNVVRVERDAGRLDAGELIAFADEALAGLAHRRVDVEGGEAAESLRAGFEAAGWLTERLVWMIHETPPAPGPDIAVVEVPFERVRPLREAWHHEDFPGVDPSRYLDQAAELARMQGARVLAVIEDDEPVAYTQVDHAGVAAEVAQVYVSPGHRGRGLGTAITCAAIEAAGDAEETWIIADDAGRPKQLYARLGFRPVWTAAECLRLPGAADERGGTG